VGFPQIQKKNLRFMFTNPSNIFLAVVIKRFNVDVPNFNPNIIFMCKRRKNKQE
jgi:hypothetical protein